MSEPAPAAKLSAPGTQAMYAAADTRTEHVASIDTSSGTCFCFTTPLASCLWCSTGACLWSPCGACKVLPPRTEAVGTVYGRYVGTWREPGLYCINPCGLTWALVSVNNRVATLTATKCTDSAGSSLIVSGVVTFRVVDAARAVLDMSSVDEYTHQQAQAVLKRVASQYRYITYDGTPSLITEQAHLGESLRALLQECVAVAGVQVVSFALSDLSFAPEIAAQMLIRQQAQATIDARKMIVAGAVGIACDAVEELAGRGKPVAPAEASRFISNLMLVICGEKAPTPTIELS